MLSQEELLSSPNYILTKYQGEIYRQVSDYLEKNKMSQTDLANKMNVSSAYVSQILNGNFNFTLKKLIELGIVIGKLPLIQFVPQKDYWVRSRGIPNDAHVNINSIRREASNSDIMKYAQFSTQLLDHGGVVPVGHTHSIIASSLS